MRIARWSFLWIIPVFLLGGCFARSDKTNVQFDELKANFKNLSDNQKALLNSIMQTGELAHQAAAIASDPEPDSAKVAVFNERVLEFQEDVVKTGKSVDATNAAAHAAAAVPTDVGVKMPKLEQYKSIAAAAVGVLGTTGAAASGGGLLAVGAGLLALLRRRKKKKGEEEENKA